MDEAHALLSCDLLSARVNENLAYPLNARNLFEPRELYAGCDLGFRYTHAAQLRAEGVEIAIISRQLGLTSITATARYLDHLAPTAVIDAMRIRRWTGA